MFTSDKEKIDVNIVHLHHLDPHPSKSVFIVPSLQTFSRYYQKFTEDIINNCAQDKLMLLKCMLGRIRGSL